MSRLRLALMVVMLPACARSPAREAADATHELRSWDATARLTDTARMRGAIPATFADQVRRAEAEGRAAAEAKLRKAGTR